MVKAENLVALAPQIKHQMELFPMGKLKAILVFDAETSNFEARYTIADYLTGDIPKPHQIEEQNELDLKKPN